MKRRVLNYGMVGGGQGAFIGDVHRKAAAFDGICRLAAGSFSRDYENTLQTGDRLSLSKERCYRTYEEMADQEATREDCMDFVSIVTQTSRIILSLKHFSKKAFMSFATSRLR